MNNIYMAPLDQFSINVIAVDLTIKSSKQDYTYLAFLNKLLMKGNQKYRTKRERLIKKADLGIQYLSMSLVNEVNHLSLRVFVTYPKVINKNQSEIIAFVKDSLTKPLVGEGMWNQEMFNEVKTEAEHYFKTLVDNRRLYASLRACEMLDESLSYYKYGDAIYRA